MQQDLIILSEYCVQYNIEPSFVMLMEEEGMIHVLIKEGKKYLYTSELTDLERFSRMYYDLSINPAGIDAIHNLLTRINSMQKEIDELRKMIRMHESRTLEEDLEATKE